MKTLRELQREFQEKNTALQALLTEQSLSAEQKEQLEALVGECEQLQASIQQAQATEQAAAQVRARAEALTTWGSTNANGTALAANTAALAGGMAQGAAPGAGAGPKRFTIPATCAYGEPKNFKPRNGYTGAERAFGFGKWFLAAMGDSGSRQWCQEHGVALQGLDQSGKVVQLAHTGNVNTAGGVLVPAEWESDLIDLREQYGVVRSLFRQRPMGSDTKNIPRRTSGVTAYFAADLVAATESSKGWDNVQLVAKKLIALVKYSSELSEDALIDIADDLMYEIGYAFAVKEDQCGINGDGTSTYGGITGVRTAILALSATRANIAGLHVGTGNLWSELTLPDFNAVKAKLPAYAATDPETCWVVSQAFWAGVMEKLMLAAGGITDAMIAAGVKPRMLGYPVKVSQAMPVTEANDQVCALLGAFRRGASFGDRRQTTLMLSEHSSFSTDGIDIRGTERFDINVHDVGNADATAANRVAGPIVGLLTAAA